MSPLGRVAAAVVCLLAAPDSPLFAQGASTMSVPPLEMSAGYALAHGVTDDRTHFPAGWYLGGALNTNQWFSVALEAAGIYGNVERTYEMGWYSYPPNQPPIYETHQSFYLADRQVHTFMAGPRFFWKTGRIMPYGQFLAGLAVDRSATTVIADGIPHSSVHTEERFAIQPGGGVTVYVTGKLGVRAGVDYRSAMHLATEIDDMDFSNAVRFTTGITLHWGGN